MEGFENIRYEINGITYCITSQSDPKFGFHNRRNEHDNSEKLIRSNRHTNFDNIEKDLEEIRNHGYIYSKARSGFPASKVKNTTTQQLDSDKFEDDTKEEFTTIKQLIVNLDSQDNSAWKQISTATMNNEIATKPSIE